MRVSSPTVFFSILLFSVFAGCSNPEAGAPPGERVSGTVTLDGKPVPGATVIFLPVGSTPGDACTGVTDQSGKYELKNRYGKPAVPVGEYKVTCSVGGGPGSDAPAGGAAPAPAPSVTIPPRYALEHESDLKAKVPAGGGTIDFKLTGK